MLRMEGWVAKPEGRGVPILLFILVGSVYYSVRRFTLESSSCVCLDLATDSGSQDGEANGCLCSET